MQFFRSRQPGPCAPRFDPALGVLSAVLQREGHQTSLLALNAPDVEALRRRITEYRPGVLYADIDATAADLARNTLGRTERLFGLHTVAGGAFVTAEPAAALSFPGVQAVVIGEAEQAFPAYLNAHLTGEPGDPIAGVWVRDESGTVRTDAHPLTVNLDDLPFADRALFENGSGADPVTCHTVSVGRGCPLACAYCPNEQVADLYAGQGPYTRRRSPEDICDEIDAICIAYPSTERIRFPEHAFAMDEDWLARFAAVYADRCGVPFECHLRAQWVTDRVADLLAAAGCVAARVDLISGSDFVRNEILGMEIGEQQLVDAFARLRARGISIQTVSFVGAPYATEVSAGALTQLHRRLKPDDHEVRVFYPLPGTRARDLCCESGWLSSRGEENFARQRSVLDMPNLPAARIDRLGEQLGRRFASRRKASWLTRLMRLPLGRNGRRGRLLRTASGRRPSQPSDAEADVPASVPHP
ncbi:MAG: radical SAM protein [bacterium]|nr:radical SAM protein [bacterium]